MEIPTPEEGMALAQKMIDEMPDSEMKVMAQLAQDHAARDRYRAIAALMDAKGRT